jgi:phage baseplate assembly protein W
MAKILSPIIVSDLNPKQGIGIDLPFEGTRLFDINYLTKDQIRANLLNLFLTNKGERIQNPNFGIGLKSLLFENNINTDKIKNLIEKQVKFYIPAVSIKNIDLETFRDENKLNISFTYSLKFEEKPQQLEIIIQ